MPPRQPRPPGAEPTSFPDLSASVGDRIKDLRTQRGLSLTALAAATRLGKGTLSELERGQRNPTLDTLFAITTALSVPLGDLLVATSGDLGPGRPPGPQAHGQNIDAELIGRWTEPAELVEVYRMTVGQGRRQSPGHTAGVIESITVVSGEVAVGPTDDPAHLTSGQSHTFPGDQDHVYEGLAHHSTTVLVMRYPLTPETTGDHHE
ncbi:XRE family transcriptional regulator [Kineosporia mesophila]|uniref:XRE family transcriptional regulator n=1 Tax=Kineosporia mesophila TaxID=566012 RepID=A0ABP6ZTQ5_9ACTN|nr:helix-turn-helix domain-containing protein [Kineosporia mesophila]MCD5354742.1 helix-turn-helix domain-containing protein [Kineosporia mesophila]